MSEDENKEESLTEEFHALGENLINTVRAAWDNPERKKLQQEIEVGLTELTTTIKNEAETFQESPTGQRLRSDIDSLQQWAQSGKTESQIRDELIKALKIANAELKKVTDKLSVMDTAPEQTPDQQTETPPDEEE